MNMIKLSNSNFGRRPALMLLLSVVCLAPLPAPGNPSVESALGPGSFAGDWYQSEWFGPVYTVFFPWVYKPELGWLYVLSVEDSKWFYQPAIGWMWTAPTTFPYLYRYNSPSWLGLIEGSQPGTVYDYAMETWWNMERIPRPFTVDVYRTFNASLEKIETSANGIPSYTQYPIQSRNGSFDLVNSANWTSGFWPGILWYAYEFSGDDGFRTKASGWTAGIASQQNNTTTHDLGFMFYCSFGNGYRLSENPTYLPTLLTAANSLATRYDSDVEAIRSWSWGNWANGSDFTVIVDNMMNLELLFWAARQDGGNPAWKEMAINHAKTTYEHFVRDDGTTYHVIVFNENTGNVTRLSNHQGYAVESAWARGMAWALHGFTTTYRESGEAFSLEAAMMVADYFIENLPEDKVPFWDYRYPTLPNTVRDSSAGAIAASGLLELADLVDLPETADHYHAAALSILEGLMGPTYLDLDPGIGFLLEKGTYNWPRGNYNSGLVWGDYYFLESMLRYINHDRAWIITGGN